MACSLAHAWQAEISYDLKFADRMQLILAMFSYLGPLSLLGSVIDSLDPFHADVARRRKILLLLVSVAFHLAVYLEQRYSQTTVSYWSDENQKNHIFFLFFTPQTMFLAAISRICFFQAKFCFKLLRGNDLACLVGYYDVRLWTEADDISMPVETAEAEEIGKARFRANSLESFESDQQPLPLTPIFPEEQQPGSVSES
eukprot:TRINITY_DN19076_c0_g1_i1.p1 TRINITY_DN19076_c0_g1~~TRINITY_DN19076_c0_g1_i1.p1  ORF type:complete len:199 (+),score=16.80 TRINITY_DN19076_c0_g1_i1:1-597(+)